MYLGSRAERAAGGGKSGVGGYGIPIYWVFKAQKPKKKKSTIIKNIKKSPTHHPGFEGRSMSRSDHSFRARA